MENARRVTQLRIFRPLDAWKPEVWDIHRSKPNENLFIISTMIRTVEQISRGCQRGG